MRKIYYIFHPVRKGSLAWEVTLRDTHQNDKRTMDDAILRNRPQLCLSWLQKPNLCLWNIMFLSDRPRVENFHNIIYISREILHYFSDKMPQRETPWEKYQFHTVAHGVDLFKTFLSCQIYLHTSYAFGIYLRLVKVVSHQVMYYFMRFVIYAQLNNFSILNLDYVSF